VSVTALDDVTSLFGTKVRSVQIIALPFQPGLALTS
jgi:hypothetical protein